MKLKSLAFAGLALAASTSYAGIESIFYGGEVNQLSDNSAESIINVAGGANTLDVDDRLRGIFQIHSIEGLTSGGLSSTLPPSSYELTGIFDITVTSKTALGGGLFNYTFAATGNLDGLGSAIVMYYDTNHEYTRINQGTIDTTAEMEALVTNGNHFMSFGLDGVDDFWTALATTDDITAIGAAGSSSVGGFYNLGLSLTANSTNLGLNAIECPGPGGSVVDMCASGSLLGTGGAATPYDSWNNVDIKFDVVPVPAPLALMGLGLLGLGATRRLRNA